MILAKIESFMLMSIFMYDNVLSHAAKLLLTFYHLVFTMQCTMKISLDASLILIILTLWEEDSLSFSLCDALKSIMEHRSLTW